MNQPQRPIRRTPTADWSGDRKVARDVEPRGDLVTFTDTPEYAKKPLSNRRKRTRLNKGGMLLGERDRFACELIAAHGWLSVHDLSALLGGESIQGLRKALRRMVRHQMLTDDCLGFNGEILYRVTTFGLAKCNLKGFSPVEPKPATLEHAAALVAFHKFVNAKFDPARACLATEREVQAAINSGVLSPRILRGRNWAGACSDFARWAPKSTTPKGRVMTKRPDALLLVERNGAAHPAVACEVERNAKTAPNAYMDIALMYAEAAKAGYLSGEVIYLCPSSDGTFKRVKAALAEAQGAGWPSWLPRIKFEMHDLEQTIGFIAPFAARGWIGRKT